MLYWCESSCGSDKRRFVLVSEKRNCHAVTRKALSEAPSGESPKTRKEKGRAAMNPGARAARVAVSLLISLTLAACTFDGSARAFAVDDTIVGTGLNSPSASPSEGTASKAAGKAPITSFATAKKVDLSKVKVTIKNQAWTGSQVKPQSFVVGGKSYSIKKNTSKASYNANKNIGTGKVKVTGKKMIEGIVAGYESSLRIGTAINPRHYLKGFHPTGTIATFGTTTAACKILGLSSKTAVNAMGLAGSLASGINQYEIDGTISKHLHPGNAARNGILSAMLAREGMTGPAEILEGRLGFFHCYADEVNQAVVDCDLGSDWHMKRIYFKPFCSCRYVHYAIEATQKNLEKRPASVAEVERIVVRTHQNGKQGSDIPDYCTPLHARLSIQYGIASILARGKAGLREYEEAAIADPEVRKVSDLVTIEVDDEIQKVYPNPRSMIVEFVLKDGGKVSTRIDHAKGDPENPISNEELIEKFKDVTSDVISEKRADEIIEASMKIDEFKNVADFAKLLQV